MFTFTFVIPQPYALAASYVVSVQLDAHAEISTWYITYADGSQIGDADFDSVADAARPFVYAKVNQLTAPASA